MNYNIVLIYVKIYKRCLPFYKVLKWGKSFGSNEKCEKAFNQLKNHLFSPLILIRPKVGETLYLFITTSKEAIMMVLIIERDGE